MKDNSKDKKLNEKQKRFCEEYIIDMNATQSAKVIEIFGYTKGVTEWLKVVVLVKNQKLLLYGLL